MPVTTGNKVASLIGAARNTVVMHQNVSVCQAILISCFDLSQRRNKIVYESLNFPSVMYVYEAHVKAAGARLVEVPSDDGVSIDTGRMIDAIDEETLLVRSPCSLSQRIYSGCEGDSREGTSRGCARHSRLLPVDRYGAFSVTDLTSTSPLVARSNGSAADPVRVICMLPRDIRAPSRQR
jgi:hypothetical protein